jgi:metal-responsive CopG/Arc/MetJ family transcriptional regulator
MKVKTSITLSQDVLTAIDELSGTSSNRSELIETAVKRFVEQVQRERRNSRDLDIINHNAAKLNREAIDVLDYQAGV